MKYILFSILMLVIVPVLGLPSVYDNGLYIIGVLLASFGVYQVISGYHNYSERDQEDMHDPMTDSQKSEDAAGEVEESISEDKQKNTLLSDSEKEEISTSVHNSDSI